MVEPLKNFHPMIANMEVVNKINEIIEVVNDRLPMLSNTDEGTDTPPVGSHCTDDPLECPALKKFVESSTLSMEDVVLQWYVPDPIDIKGSRKDLISAIKAFIRKEAERMRPTERVIENKMSNQMAYGMGYRQALNDLVERICK